MAIPTDGEEVVARGAPDVEIRQIRAYATIRAVDTASPGDAVEVPQIDTGRVGVDWRQAPYMP